MSWDKYWQGRMPRTAELTGETIPFGRNGEGIVFPTRLIFDTTSGDTIAEYLTSSRGDTLSFSSLLQVLIEQTGNVDRVKVEDLQHQADSMILQTLGIYR